MRPDTNYTEQNVLNRTFDDSFQVINVHNLHYDPSTDSLVSGTTFFGITKFEWETGNCIYKGTNLDVDAADGDSGWTVYKYGYTGSDCTSIKVKPGTWTGRAALFA